MTLIEGTARPGSLDADKLPERFHTLLDALLAFGAGLVIWADSYPRDAFEDAITWLLRHHEECVGEWRDHIDAFAIVRRDDPRREILLIYRSRELPKAE